MYPEQILAGVAVEVEKDLPGGPLGSERRATVARVDALEGACDLEEEMFAGNAADELEADRETGRRESAGNGNGGDTGEIGGTIRAEEQGAGGVIFFADED